MEIRFDGKVALITGSSRGIGLAIASELAASGARVMLSSRKAEALEAAAATLPGEVAWFAANAGEPDQAEACVAATMERFGAVDILVNNAATNPYMGPTIDIDLPRLDKTIAVNWRAPLFWSRLAWEASMRGHGGVILNVASVGGLTVESSIGAYNATKAALLHLTRTLAAELAPGVRVNAIAPGLVKTDMARALWEQHEEAIAGLMPMRRLGEPEDIGRAAAFLCSDAASWITGTTTIVDGGAMLGRG
jgi:NAD(P)-dependent dehydrogenase (short-subunit alcohol dehydrogenase family)